MENVMKNPCKEHYSHRCEDCEHHKEESLIFKDSIFEIEEKGYHCVKHNVFSSKKEMKNYPVYNSDEITGEMARKHIRFTFKCESIKGEFEDINLNGITAHIEKGVIYDTTDARTIQIYGSRWLHVPCHTAGICYENGVPYPSCPFMYNIQVKTIKILDETTLEFTLPLGHEFFNGATMDRIELAAQEVWLTHTEKLTTTKLINKYV